MSTFTTLDLFVEADACGASVQIGNNYVTATARGNLRDGIGRIFHARVMRTATDNGDGTFCTSRYFPGYRDEDTVQEQATFTEALAFLLDDDYIEPDRLDAMEEG